MRRITLFIVCLLIWYLLVWPYDFQQKTIDVQGIVAGVIVSLFVALLFYEIIMSRPKNIYHIKRYLWALYYLPVFFYYCIKANLDVAYRVIHPELPIKPGIVKVKTSLKTPSGITALCNSITLTPGTLTVDVTDDGYLYIHWINVQSQDVEEASRIIVAKFEKILKRIFE